VLGDGDHGNTWRCDSCEGEEVTELDVVQGPWVVWDGVDVELDAFELPTVEERDDRVAQSSFVGLGGHRSEAATSKRNPSSRSVSMAASRMPRSVRAKLARWHPRPWSLGLCAESCQQRLPALQRPRAGWDDDHEPGQ
jgi:hypothetical protein